MIALVSLGGGPRGFIPLKGKKLTPLWADQNNVIINNKYSKYEVSMKKSFTLAEVLITLGVIGIVAAMTLPTLINKHNKQVTVTRLKQSYAILSEAVKQSEVVNGSSEYWNYETDGETFYKTYLKNYVKVISEEFLSDLNAHISYKGLSGGTVAALIEDGNNYTIKLPNGSIVIIASREYSNYKVIGIDVNGFANPNQIGRDLFYFAVSKRRGVQPYGLFVGTEKVGENYTRDTLTKDGPAGYEYAACNKAQVGHLCTLLIMHDGWEMKDDYPW